MTDGQKLDFQKDKCHFDDKILLSCRSGVRIPPETPYKDKKSHWTGFFYAILKKKKGLDYEKIF